MGGIDLLDRIIAKYRQNAKTRKWTVRLIFRFVDFACAASWVEYRRDCAALKIKQKNIKDYLDFKIAISEWMVYSHTPVNDSEIYHSDEDTESPARKRQARSPLPSQSKRKHGSDHMPDIVDDGKTHCCRMPGCKSV